MIPVLRKEEKENTKVGGAWKENVIRWASKYGPRHR